MSPRELDEIAGLGREGTRNILRGRSAAPRSATLQSIADALGIPVGVFFGEAEAPANPLAIPRSKRKVGVMMRPRLPEGQDDLEPPLPGIAPPGLCDVGVYDLRPRQDPVPEIMHFARRTGAISRLPSMPLSLAGASTATVAAVQAPGEGFPPEVQPGTWILVDTADTVPTRGVYVVWDGASHMLARLHRQPVPPPHDLFVELADKVRPPNLLEGYTVSGRVIMRFATM